MRNNLVGFRHKLGLTQEEMGGLFNLNRQQWCNIELGTRKGSAVMWVNLGIKFNLTLKELKKLMEVS